VNPKTLLLPIAVLLAAPGLRAEAEGQYPVIKVLSRDDALFVQQQAELDEFRRITESRSAAPQALPSLDIFEYRRRASEDLFALNARLGLRYDTLATLNGAASRDAFSQVGTVLIPSQDGLFINDPPLSDLESMVLSTRLADGAAPQKLRIVRGGRTVSVSYFPREAFSGVERAYFLRILYVTPIAKGQITSMYGWRADPFTGARSFHGGIDIGAPMGTPVRAAREGTVDEIGSDERLGSYIVLSHPGGYQTVYGHLSAINVTMKDRVSAGTEIGSVGVTGRTTGPHLHFEVRTRKGTEDPLDLIRVKNG
jgi:murein DD-endopeptidase MepM/ murein hydrolase activator NlpD